MLSVARRAESKHGRRITSGMTGAPARLETSVKGVDLSELWAPFLVQHGFEQSDDPRDVLIWNFVYKPRRPFP